MICVLVDWRVVSYLINWLVGTANYDVRTYGRECSQSVLSQWCSIVLFFIDVKFQLFLGKIMWSCSHFFSTSLYPWKTRGSSVFSDIFPIYGLEAFLKLCPLISPPRRPLAVDIRRILIPEFIRSHPTLFFIGFNFIIMDLVYFIEWNNSIKRVWTH